MIEGTKRSPHVRNYVDAQGRHAYIDVDDHGLVIVSEELFDQLLQSAGFIETTEPSK